MLPPFPSACLAKGFLINTKSQAGPRPPQAVIPFQNEERTSVCAQKMLELSECQGRKAPSSVSGPSKTIVLTV